MKSQEQRISQIKARCAALIKRETETRDVTQDELAKEMGIGENAFRQYATERTPVPLYHLETFCSYMRVSIEYIITGGESPLIEAYNALDDDEKRIAEKVLGVKKPLSQKKQRVA